MEPEAEADPLEEDSRPAPRFVEIGVETDEQMGDFVPLYEYLRMTENLDEHYITRAQHHQEINALERDWAVLWYVLLCFFVFWFLGCV